MDSYPHPRVTPLVCILDDGRIMGGGQRFALRLARYLVQTRGEDSVVLACPEQSALAEAAHLAGVSVAGATFPDMRLPAVGQAVFAIFRVRRLIRSLSPTLLIGNSARCQTYAAVAMVGLRNRAPLAYLLHEQDSADRAVLRMLYRRAGRVEAVGARAATTYRNRLPGVDVRQVNNFLGADELRCLRSLPKPLPTDPRSAVIGVLGRMIPEKGILELVDELAAAGTDAWGELRIAALAQQPAYERRVRERITDLGLGRRIRLVGAVSDTAAFLRETDVLIVPSIGNEGQPTVILEALAARRAVIVRRPLYSEDYDGLAVLAYQTPDDLRAALLSLPEATTADVELPARFSAEQVLAALER